MENEKRIRVASTIIQQMGGHLKSMIKANTFQSGEDDKGQTFLSFRFKASRRHNYCKITLTWDDLYTMSIGQIRNKTEEVVPGITIKIPTYKERYNQDRLFCDQLVETFERETGLYLSL